MAWFVMARVFFAGAVVWSAALLRPVHGELIVNAFFGAAFAAAVIAVEMRLRETSVSESDDRDERTTLLPVRTQLVDALQDAAVVVEQSLVDLQRGCGAERWRDRLSRPQQQCSPEPLARERGPGDRGPVQAGAAS
jgi:hypothetical protein